MSTTNWVTTGFKAYFTISELIWIVSNYSFHQKWAMPETHVKYKIYKKKSNSRSVREVGKDIIRFAD